MASGTLFGRSLAAGQIERGVDQRDVRERLRKVSELAPRRGSYSSAKRPTSLRSASRRSKSSRASAMRPCRINCRRARSCRREMPLRPVAGRPPPLRCRSGITNPSTIKPLLDRLHRADDARVGRRQKADERQQQQARIERLRPVGLNKAAELGIERLAADVLVDLVAHPPPALERVSRQPPSCSQILDRPVEGDPRHDLGMREMLRRSAHLPNALVGLIPDLAPNVQARPARSRPRVDRGQAVAVSMVERVEDLAVNVELRLIDCGVADADRARSFISGQPWHLPLGQPPLAAQPVHDLQLIGAARYGAKQPIAPCSAPRRNIPHASAPAG